MIEEIFITYNDKVILGDIDAYPKNPEYPTHVLDNNQLTQFKVNDVVLSALYTDLDVFFVLDYLEKLKGEIENDVSKLNYKNVQEYYFSILEIIHRYQVVIIPKERTNSFIYIQSNDIYVDVIETYNVVINSGVPPKVDDILDDNDEIALPSLRDNSILRNEVVGFCFVKPSFIDSKTVKLIISKSNLNYVSKYKVMEKFNKIEVEMDVTNQNLEVFKYATKSKNNPPVKLTKEGGGFKLTTEDLLFDFLEIQIPVPEQIKRLNIKNSKGRISHDENKSVVKWAFKNEKVGNSFISFEMETFNKQKYSNEVTVSFSVSKTDKSHLKIEKAVCLGHPGVNVWIKYDLCTGTYKIRV